VLGFIPVSGILPEGGMKLGLFAGLAGAAVAGLLATAAPSQAAVLTIDLDNYASAVDTTPGVLMGTMTVTDAAGGVDVKVSLDAATFFAVTGGHITIGWNVSPATAATMIAPTTPTYTAETNISPPGCEVSCGSFTNGLQGTWHGTDNSFDGPVTFFLAGITTADFKSNSAGFMGAIDALGPNGTGEIAGAGTIATIPEPSTWAMMLLGFAGLGFLGYRKATTAQTAFSAA
jgi:PEP-CTERM motif